MMFKYLADKKNSFGHGKLIEGLAVTVILTNAGFKTIEEYKERVFGELSIPQYCKKKNSKMPHDAQTGVCSSETESVDDVGDVADDFT